MMIRLSVNYYLNFAQLVGKPNKSLVEHTDTRYLIPNSVLLLYVGEFGGPPAGPTNPGFQMLNYGKR